MEGGNREDRNEGSVKGLEEREGLREKTRGTENEGPGGEGRRE